MGGVQCGLLPIRAAAATRLGVAAIGGEPMSMRRTMLASMVRYIYL